MRYVKTPLPAVRTDGSPARTRAKAIQSKDLGPHPRIFTAGFAIYCLGVAFLPAAAVRVSGLALSDLLLTLSAAIVILSQKEIPRPSALFQVATMMAAISIMVASLSTVDLTEHFSTGARVLYIFVVWQWVTRALITSAARLRLVLGAYLMGSLASASVGLLQISSGLVLGGELVNGRAPGLQAHPNGQGGVLVLAAIICVGLLVKSRWWPVAIFTLVPIALALVASGSVTAMLVSLFGSLVILLATRPTITSLLVSLLTCLAAWAIVSNWGSLLPGAVSPVDRFLDTTGQGEGESTLGSRLATQRFALDQLLSGRVWGVGLDGVSGVTYDQRTLTHNLLLRSAYEGGWILALSILVVTVFAVRQAVRIRRIPETTWAGAVVCVGVFAMISYALTGPVLQERWYWLPILLAIAYGETQNEVAKSSAPDPVRSS